MFARVPERKYPSFQPPIARTGIDDRVEPVDERPVAPELVERRVRAVRGELRVGVDHAAAGQVGDVGPVVDLAPLGRLDAAREHHVVVERRRRLQRARSRPGARDVRPRRCSSSAPPKLSPYIPMRPSQKDCSASHSIRSWASRPHWRKLPWSHRPPGAPTPRRMGTSATYPRDGEEVGLAEVEVAQHDVRGELDHDARERAVDGPTVARRTTEIARRS